MKPSPCPRNPNDKDSWGNVNPIGIRACYDEGKRVAETLTYSYQRQDNVDVRVARIFNTFGPRMNVSLRDLSVWSSLTVYTAIRWSRCLQLHYPGSQRRRHDGLW
jgi:nucleoside-diphosphate-sugar epimerase